MRNVIQMSHVDLEEFLWPCHSLSWGGHGREVHYGFWVMLSLELCGRALGL